MTSRASEAVSRPSGTPPAWGIALVLASVLYGGCDELGNPEQLTTGPTVWKTPRHELVTTSHSFRSERTIRRLVEDGLENFDVADPSIGPGETLTLVTVAARRLRPLIPDSMRLVTRFAFRERAPVTRQWAVSGRSRQWRAAFALPAAPTDAITSVAP